MPTVTRRIKASRRPINIFSLGHNVSAADTNSSSAPPPPLAACDGSLFEVTPTFVAGTALKVVTASLFSVCAPHELLLRLLILVLAYIRV